MNWSQIVTSWNIKSFDKTSIKMRRESMKVKYLQENWQRLVIIAIVLIYTSIGIYHRVLWRINNNLWQDENYQVNQIPSSFWLLITNHFDMQFSGDNILIYPFYRIFGKDKWGLAIPHIIITLIGFYLFYLLCKKYFRTIVGYLISFTLFAYNYNLHYHSFEIRPYSVLITLSLASFLICKYIIENEKSSVLIRTLVCLFIFMVSFFHLWGAYSLFFIYVFHLLMSRKGKSINRLLYSHMKYYGITVLITLLLLWKVLSVPTYSWGSTPDTFQFIPKGVISIAKGVFGNLTGRQKFYPLLIGLIISLLIPHKERLKQLLFFMILIVIPIALLLLICVIHPYWFIQRHFIWAIPLFAFFIGWCWDSIIIYFAVKFKLYKDKLS